VTVAEFFSDYVWPLIIMVAESLLLLVILLIAIVHVLYADRKIWAAEQIRRGPNVVAPQKKESARGSHAGMGQEFD
jgi:NADH-quinone oxidoreductase subunit H